MSRFLRTGLLLLALLFAILPARSAHAQEPRPLDDGRTEAPSVPAPRPALAAGELTTARFRFVYTARAEGSARALAGRIEKVRDSFAEVLGRDWPGVTEIRMGVGRGEFEAMALPGGKPPGWAAALAYPQHNIILLDALSLVKPDGETTLRHELSHVALGQLSVQGWPHWFQEGVAMYLTGDRFSLVHYTALFRAVTQNRLLHFADLNDGWPQRPDDVEIAYAQSVTFISHLVERYGPERIGQLIDEVRAGTAFEVAFAHAFKTSLDVEEQDWARELPSRYSWMPIVTGGSAIWGVAALLAVAGWLRRRYVRARRFAEMEAEEAAEDEALRLAEAAAAFASADDETATPEEVHSEVEPNLPDDKPPRILH